MTCPACQAENEAGATACAHCGASLQGLTPTSVIVTINLSPGTLFHGRYVIQGPLGRGGMGMVYRANDRTLDEDVAIKVLRPEFAEDPKMAERFKSEIKLARRIRHRNVCAIHDFGEDHGVLYISMELIDGVDLKHVLKRRGALPPQEAYDLAIQLAEGLEAVHASGVIHRDLKTPNIMVDGGGVARLMDFGIAKRQEGGGASTATGHVLGTPEYMSPEQAQGKRLDARSDVYALGIVIYEIFTGDVPFRGETPISTILKHLQDQPLLDRSKLPSTLRPLLAKALAKEPDGRYASARAVADALREARTPSSKQQPVATEVLLAPTLPGPSIRKPPARSRWQPWLLAIPIVAVGAGVLLLRRPAAPVATPAPAVTAPAMLLEPTPTPPPKTLAPPSTTALATPRPSPTPRATRIPPSVVPAAPAPIPTPVPTPPPTTAPPPPTTAAPMEPGLLQLAVRPWAEVSIDGRLIGTTPLDRLSLTPGAHTVTLRHPAYEPLARTVTIRSGETARLVVDLAHEGRPRQD